MIRKWSIFVPASELQFDNMEYTLLLPILGPCGHGCSVEKEVVDGTIRLCHTGWRGCVTEAVIELPGDVVGSECVVHHGGNTLTLSVQHHQHSRWWDGVVALCIAAEEGDGALWDKAWTMLERLALEMVGAKSVRERANALMETTPLAADVATTIAERSFLAEEGWMQGGAMFPLHFAHAAMDCEHPAPGALGRLEQMLTSRRASMAWRARAEGRGGWSTSGRRRCTRR